jgi:hypothetical protein
MHTRFWTTLLTATAFVMPVSHAFAQGVTFDAEVTQTEVVLGSQVKLMLKINGTQRVPPFEINALDGFDVHYIGPQTNVQIINGQYSSSITYNYALIPQRVGTLNGAGI